MKRKRTDAPATPERTQPQPAAPPGLAGRVLALQRSAGNRAVGAMLARTPVDAPQVYDTTVILPGLGRISLDSLSLVPQRREGDHGNGPTDVQLVSAVGEHSTALQKAAIDGTAFKTVEIFAPSGSGVMHLTLTNAMLTSYSVGAGGDNPRETWSLTSDKITVTFEGG